MVKKIIVAVVAIVVLCVCGFLYMEKLADDAEREAYDQELLHAGDISNLASRVYSSSIKHSDDYAYLSSLQSEYEMLDSDYKALLENRPFLKFEYINALKDINVRRVDLSEKINAVDGQ